LKKTADDIIFVVAAVNIDVYLATVAAVHRKIADARFRRVKVSDWARFRRNN
jgi:hypothetical protein